MKKKFIIIGTISVAVIAAIVIVVLLLTGKEKKITVSFDADGGKPVSSIKIKNGQSIKLPHTENEGFTLDGWYLDDQRVTDSTTFAKDVTLKAKWISNDAETFTITFDSVGGSKVDSIKVECGKELSLPTNPTKDGYTFVSWIDKNETPILDKALLSCEDITLKANWKKEETKKDENKPYQKTNTSSNANTNVTSSQPEKQKSYKCPSGYELTEENKCETKVHVTEICESGYTKSESRGLCYKTAELEEYCKSNSYFPIGNGQCATQPLWPSGDGNKEKCESHGWKYGDNGKCYYALTSAMYKCPSGYISRPAGWADPSQISTACIETIATTDTCPDGYSRDGSWCYKTINATYE